MPKKILPIPISTPSEAADRAEELRTIRTAISVSRTRELRVSAGLIAWLDEQREPFLEVEGQPTLRIMETSGWLYDVPRIARENPELLMQLALAGALDLSIGKLRTAVSREQVTEGTRQYRSPKPMVRSLRFDTEEP
jgi:hypothetical protein